MLLLECSQSIPRVFPYCSHVPRRNRSSDFNNIFIKQLFKFIEENTLTRTSKTFPNRSKMKPWEPPGHPWRRIRNLSVNSLPPGSPFDAKGIPKGVQKSTLLLKVREKVVTKRRLESIPEKRIKIYDFRTLQTPPDRAETAARAQFSLFLSAPQKS